MSLPTDETEQSSDSRRPHERLIAWVKESDTRIAKIRRPFGTLLRVIFFVFAVLVLLALGVTCIAGIVLFGLCRFWYRNPFFTGFLLVVGAFGGEFLSYHYRDLGDKSAESAWGIVALCCTGLLVLRLAVSWLGNPTFNVEAAKGLYMGQSLNNQRQIRDDLSAIRKKLGD